MMAAQRDYAGAEKELREVLTRRQQRIPDHPDSLAARHEIARMLAAKGNISEARAEFQDVLATKTRVLGPDHPSTAMTVHEIESLAASQNATPCGHASLPEEPNNWILPLKPLLRPPS